MTTIHARPDLDKGTAVPEDVMEEYRAAQRRKQHRIEICTAELTAADEMIADLRSLLAGKSYFERQDTLEEIASIGEMASRFRRELAELRDMGVAVPS